MLAKKYRLKEREVKKVLQRGKPFFSYTLVFNYFPHTLWVNQFAIVIGKKSVPNNVVRNMHRRIFYDICREYSESISGNIVCVVKTKTRLWRDPQSLQAFTKELRYLFEKKLWKNT